jgi:hypothetical protein
MAQAVSLRHQAQTALDQARQSGLLNADLAKAQYVSLPVFVSVNYPIWNSACSYCQFSSPQRTQITAMPARPPAFMLWMKSFPALL